MKIRGLRGEKTLFIRVRKRGKKNLNNKGLSHKISYFTLLFL